MSEQTLWSAATTPAGSQATNNTVAEFPGTVLTAVLGVRALEGPWHPGCGMQGLLGFSFCLVQHAGRHETAMHFTLPAHTLLALTLPHPLPSPAPATALASLCLPHLSCLAPAEGGLCNQTWGLASGKGNTQAHALEWELQQAF